MLAHFSFLAASVDIELPDWLIAMLAGAVLVLVIVGLVIYILLKKKRQPDGKN